MRKILNYFMPDTWALVHRFRLDTKYNGDPIAIYYYFSESRKGKRKVDIKSTHTFPNYDSEAPKRSVYYLDTVHPWLQGAYSVDIPRYADMPAENLVKALKG